MRLMAKKPTIEQCFAAVEKAISDLEDGELPLETSLSVYEAGLKHVRQAHALDAFAKRLEAMRELEEGGQADDASTPIGVALLADDGVLSRNQAEISTFAGYSNCGGAGASACGFRGPEIVGGSPLAGGYGGISLRYSRRLQSGASR